MTPRNRPLAVLAVVMAVLGGLTTLTGPAPRPAGTTRPVVVLAQPGALEAARAAVRAAGGTVRRTLPLVGGLAVTLPVRALPAVAGDPAVRSLTPDAAVTLSDISYGGTPVQSSYVGSTGAPTAWSRGSAGAGVTVAVLDTGVQPVGDLAGRVVAGPDFSGEHDSLTDSFGHGTVMAGLIAGNGAGSRSLSSGAYVGMAPAAKVVSVKVAGRSGATDVSTVLAALQWIGSFHDQYGIRVVNLSWGTPSRQPVTVDPLDLAVERLWRAGVVVVAAAGNAGSAAGTVTKPGDDPVILTAGAYDEGAGSSKDDDAVATWSGRGPTADGFAKPDLIAPGRSLVSAVAPNSVVAQQHADALLAGGYIRGSGTSQATAVTSGAVALLLSARPDASPPEVKQALRSTADRISGGGDYTVQGRGRVAVDKALDATGQRDAYYPAHGGGSLEASRGGQHVVTTCAGQTTPTTITGEMDALCRAFSSESWSSESWSSESWSSESWSSESWSSESWSSESWSSESWSATGFATAAWGDQPASGALKDRGRPRP